MENDIEKLEELEEIQESEEVKLEEQENIEIYEAEEIEDIEYTEQAEEIEEDEYFEEQYQRTKPIGKLITLVAFTAIMLISTTYAWFSTQKNVTLGGLQGVVNVAEGLQISLDAKTWKNEIDFGAFTENAQGELVSDTYLPGATLQKPYITEYEADGTTPKTYATNIIPEELLPVSTTANVNEGIGSDYLPMYWGEITDSVKLSDIKEKEEEAESGYFAIDVFLQNTSSEDKTIDLLQVDQNSTITLLGGTQKETTGLQNTVRVGLALYDNTGDDKIKVNSTPTTKEIIQGTVGQNIIDVAIWEPNANAHVQYVVDVNNYITWNTTDAEAIYGTGASVNTKFGLTTQMPTYALTSGSTTATYTPTGVVSPVRGIEDIYNWSNAGVVVSKVAKQYTLQTPSTGVSEPTQLVSSKDGTTEFSIAAGEYHKVRLYIWLEGQDVDCVNYVSLGGGIDLNFGFSKSSPIDGGAEEIVPITEIALDKTNEELTVGESLTLTATINADAVEDVIWESSNSAVATVTENLQVALLGGKDINSSVRVAGVNGSIENILVASSTQKTVSATITALSAGTTTITAKNTDGSISQTCTVTVVEDEEEEVVLPSIAVTGPYLPTGFSWANTEHTEILDPSNNQYVWVSVPRDATVYNDLTDDTEDTAMSDTTNEDILAFDVNNLTTENLAAIEKELHEYTATYRNGTTHKDEFCSKYQHGFANPTAYNNHKNAMLTSVFKNGGFYVGKYETGIADNNPDAVEARTEAGEATQQPVIQANAYPYNYVTNRQAQELASTKFNGGGYTTSLMFGVQWDLVLKHLEVINAASTPELKSDSTEWGNYNNNDWTIENNSAKYSDDYGESWNDGVDMTNSGDILLSTGASTEFERGGVYDLAGNIYEWTLEYTSSTYRSCANRGGDFINGGSGIPASYRGKGNTSFANAYIGFRVSLY